MKEAIEKAVYYTDYISEQYNLPVATFEFRDRENLSEILSSLTQNVDIITNFASKKDSCYPIFNHIYYCYDSLLLDNVNALFLVNRKDFCIKLIKADKNNTENQRFAIIKTDSVFSELFSSKSFSWKYLFLPGFILLGGAMVFSWFDNNNDLAFWNNR